MTALNAGPSIYWHRDLPPRAAEALGEHVVEASSSRVAGTLAHGDALWTSCHEDLMRHVRIRFEQEIARLGGHYAHVLNESIEPHHDAATGDAWMQGRFTYMLYR